MSENQKNFEQGTKGWKTKEWDGKRESYALTKRLTAKHMKIVDYLMEGMEAKDIAGVMGLKPETVARQINTPLLQNELARRRGDWEKQQNYEQKEFMNDAKQILEEAGVNAANTMVGLLGDQDPSIKLRSAKEILDYSVSKEQGGGVANTTINIEQLQILNTALAESKVG